MKTIEHVLDLMDSSQEKNQLLQKALRQKKGKMAQLLMQSVLALVPKGMDIENTVNEQAIEQVVDQIQKDLVDEFDDPQDMLTPVNAAVAGEAAPNVSVTKKIHSRIQHQQTTTDQGQRKTQEVNEERQRQNVLEQPAQTDQATQRDNALDQTQNPEEQVDETENQEQPDAEETETDTAHPPSVDETETPDSKDDEVMNESEQSNPDTQTAETTSLPPKKQPTQTQNNQQADIQLKQQQAMEAMSKQQLSYKLQQLQQEKRTLQKKQLDDQEIQTSFGLDQAALFIPALTTLAYIVDLIDITEFIAPLIDFIVACVALYWRATRSAKLKLFYLKRLPSLIFTRFLGMIPFVSYLFPEIWAEIKTLLGRMKKFRKAVHSVKSIEKQIAAIDKQIATIQKQLNSRRSFLRRTNS